MTIPNIRAFFDTAAIQTMTGDTESAAQSNSAFSSLISEVLNNNSSSTPSDLTNYLGAIPSLVEATNTTSSTANTAMTLLNALSSSSVSTYLPPSLYTVLSEQSTKAQTATATAATKKQAEATPSYAGSVAFTGKLEGANKYSALIEKAAKQYDLDPKLIASIMKQESNFNNSVKSHAGATGLMQLMPGTAKYVGVSNSLDPEQNIMGGAKYLRMMLDQFGGDLTTALAAYNAGPGNVKKYGGIPPFKETQNYVVKVKGYYQS